MTWFKKLICLVMFFVLPGDAQARTQLTLKYNVQVQTELHDPVENIWQTVEEVDVDGIGSLQVHLYPNKKYRLKLTVSKPYDLKGVYKIRTPIRHDSIVLGPKTTKGTIILGPHKGCEKEKRCNPFTTEEIGMFEFRMDIEKAERSSFGVLLIRPYEEQAEGAARAAITFRNETISCGSTIDKGWWIFASSFHSNANPLDNISLCLHEPDGDVRCSKDNKHKVSVKANQRGRYEFINWNRTPTGVVCFINSV